MLAGCQALLFPVSCPLCQAQGCLTPAAHPLYKMAAQPRHGLFVIYNHFVQHTAFSLLMTALLSSLEPLPHNLSEILLGMLIFPLLVTSLWLG